MRSLLRLPTLTPTPALVASSLVGLSLVVSSLAPSSLVSQTRTTRSIHHQRHDSRYTMIMHDDDRALSVMMDGEVEFNDDDTDVVSLGNGAYLIIDENRRGEPTRRIEFRGSGTEFRRTYTVNGELRRDEADQKAWLARILPELAREQGLNAERRVKRILEKEGPDGVLREIRKIRSDGVKRTYLLLLVGNASLNGAQTATALRIVETEISSDGDKASVLRTLIPRLNLTEGNARDAFFSAASSISSDGDRSRVLLAALSRTSRDPASLTALLVSAGGISSDGDRSRVLIGAASAPALEASNARDAWFEAAGGVSSDGDRSRALLAILQQHGQRDDVTVAALRSARQISSDGDKTRVLLAVAPERLRSAQVSAAYDSALDSISSDGDHRRAEQHVRSVRR